MNTYGNIFRLTTFGESHGPAIGGVVDGMPAGIEIYESDIQAELDRRRPGSSELATARREDDRVELLSGIFEGRSTGTPIGFVIRNSDHHSADYLNLRDTYRPGHADYTYAAKYGIRDHRGGGRSSARETASRVVGGALAKQALRRLGITVTAYATAIGGVRRQAGTQYEGAELTPGMEAEILAAKAQGDTVGGVVTCVIRGCPPGLGEPVFGKLHAMLGAAMLGINACKGVEFGMGFEGAAMRGSQVIDNWVPDPADPRCIHAAANHSGGIQGGISNGEDIVMRLAFKPIATLLQPVETVNSRHEAVTLQARGRHDPCVVPRAIVIVEAMAAMTVLDAWLLNRSTRM